MRIRLRTLMGLLAALAVLPLMHVAMQAQATRGTSGANAAYSAPRTPWGDPDLQGNYTNTYENGTPLERPDEFAGRKLEDIKGDELADAAAQHPAANDWRISRARSMRRTTGGRTI